MIMIICLVVAIGLRAGLTSRAAAPAPADSLAFKRRSFHTFSVGAKFYPRKRDSVWPVPASHRTIKDRTMTDDKLTCLLGGRICHGAATSGSGHMTRGVGLAVRGGCCACNGDASTSVLNLNEV
jgi:hypothetical protein